MNYLRKLEFKIELKMRSVEAEGKTEERKKLREEWKTIVEISYNSNPNIPQTWNPLRIQRIIEKVHKKAPEKELDKNEVKKESSMKKLQKNETNKKWFFRAILKELVTINPDSKSVRTMLLAYKDHDEGRIDKERFERLLEEFVQSAKKNNVPSPEEFMEKYPIFNPLKKKRKKEVND